MRVTRSSPRVSIGASRLQYLSTISILRGVPLFDGVAIASLPRPGWLEQLPVIGSGNG
jgi:hypothetical protein